MGGAQVKTKKNCSTATTGLLGGSWVCISRVLSSTTTPKAFFKGPMFFIESYPMNLQVGFRIHSAAETPAWELGSACEFLAMACRTRFGGSGV